MDVRPAARIAARVDRRERHAALRVGDLHAAQVVLAGDALRVERITTARIAVPEVDREPFDRTAVGGRAEELQRDFEQRTGRDIRARRAETRTDVRSHDAALRQYVRPV